jgi:subtilisin family serine protease
MRITITAALLHGAIAVTAFPACAQQSSGLTLPDNHYFRAKGSWGQNYSDQWGLQRIGFDASDQSAWRLIKKDAQPVTVALIDTGLDWDHRNIDPENLWRNPNPGKAGANQNGAGGYADDAIGWDFFDRDNKPWDNDGHGTFVAGIIAGSWKDKDGIAGINPLARLMILKAVNNFGHSRASYLAEAIAYAVDHGARVINLSAGGKGSTKVEQAAIDYAYSKGVIIVVAAGNDGEEISKYGIANSDKVLTVATTGLDDKRANFSNWGKVAVAAPGIDILSLRARRTDTLLGIPGVKYTDGAAYVGNDKRYYRASGTSFSAPMVSGLASLLLANDPTLTNRQVMNIIKSTARDVGTPGVDQYTGYGIIDARAALSAAKDYALLAGISRVEVIQKGGAQTVRVRGQAEANDFKSARIEVGSGHAPTTWTVIGSAKPSSESDGVLGEIPATAFKGATVWQIRLVVSHGNGASREVRYRLTLG